MSWFGIRRLQVLCPWEVSADSCCELTEVLGAAFMSAWIAVVLIASKAFAYNQTVFFTSGVAFLVTICTMWIVPFVSQSAMSVMLLSQHWYVLCELS